MTSEPCVLWWGRILLEDIYVEEKDTLLLANVDSALDLDYFYLGKTIFALE